jgi:hypothetical protein
VYGRQTLYGMVTFVLFVPIVFKGFRVTDDKYGEKYDLCFALQIP